MDNTTLSHILELSEDKTLNGAKLKRITEKCSNLIAKMNEGTDTILGNTQRCMLLPVAFVMGLRGCYYEIHDRKRREKAFSKMFDVNPEMVTGDLTTFISSDTRFPYFVDSFQYDASVSLDRMKALAVIWGDANLQKLHDFNYATGLNVVIGDLYTSTAINPSGLENLQVVTGDMHMEQFDDLDFLNESLYVGGKVYTKKGVVSKKMK